MRLRVLALVLFCSTVGVGQQPADRHVPLEGTPNFRDLGGYAVKGGVVRPGVLYRSGTLEALTEKDHEVLKKLGVKTVVDLRTDYEAQKAPDKLPAGVKYVHLPVGKDEDVKRYFEPKTAEDVDKLLKPGAFTTTDGKPGYDYTATFGDSYAKLMALVSDPANHPLVFHCTAGKDRTGVAAAVVLWTLGASDETVADDYVLTDKYFKADSEKRLLALRKKLAEIKGVKEDEIDLSGMKARMGTKREVILGTKAKIEAECGSWEKFTAGTLKLSPDQLKSLKAALVEPKK